MSPSAKFDPFHSRYVTFEGIRNVDDWRIKLYTMTREDRFQSNETMQAALSQIGHWIHQHSQAYAFDCYGIATLLMHEGSEGIYAIANWWTGQDMLQNYIYLARYDEPTKFNLISRDGLCCCVWELGVIWHERNAWVRHVLEKANTPDFEGYLVDTISGPIGAN